MSLYKSDTKKTATRFPFNFNQLFSIVGKPCQSTKVAAPISVAPASVCGVAKHYTLHMGQGSSAEKEGNAASKFSPKKGLIQCKKCTRNFALERIETHENICTKPGKKRKPFDMMRARIEGTEAEQFVEKKQKTRKKVFWKETIDSPKVC